MSEYSYDKENLSVDYFKNLIEATGDAIITLDLEGNTKSWNKAAEEIFGYSASEIIGRPILLFQGDEIKNYTFRIKSGGIIQNLPSTEKNKKGEELHLLLTMLPVKNQAGEVMAVTLILKNISDIKKVELMKSEFLSMLSHELRTPLSQICGFAELLLESIYGQINEDERQAISDILSQGKHLTNLINSILWFSGVEAGRKIELKKVPVFLDSLINEIAEPMLKDFKVKNITLNIKSNENNGAVSADISQIEKVVENILNNALKFVPEGGTVKIYTEKQNGRLLAVFEDNGIGLALDHLEKVFEKFFRVDSTTTRQTEGIGMGLAVAKAIIDVHGGQIWAESNGLGHGSKFCFTLPVS